MLWVIKYPPKDDNWPKSFKKDYWKTKEKDRKVFLKKLPKFLFLMNAPQSWQFVLQLPNSPVMGAIVDFHNDILGLLIFISTYKTPRPLNPRDVIDSAPLLEWIWTIVPFFIIVSIAWPSILLLFATDEVPQAQLVCKAVSLQWFWSYVMHNKFEVLKVKAPALNQNILPSILNSIFKAVNKNDDLHGLRLGISFSENTYRYSFLSNNTINALICKINYNIVFNHAEFLCKEEIFVSPSSVSSDCSSIFETKPLIKNFKKSFDNILSPKEESESKNYLRLLEADCVITHILIKYLQMKQVDSFDKTWEVYGEFRQIGSFWASECELRFVSPEYILQC